MFDDCQRLVIPCVFRVIEISINRRPQRADTDPQLGTDLRRECRVLANGGYAVELELVTLAMTFAAFPSKFSHLRSPRFNFANQQSPKRTQTLSTALAEKRDSLDASYRSIMQTMSEFRARISTS